jgi:hypothetical protein
LPAPAGVAGRRRPLAGQRVDQRAGEDTPAGDLLLIRLEAGRRGVEDELGTAGARLRVGRAPAGAERAHALGELPAEREVPASVDEEELLTGAGVEEPRDDVGEAEEEIAPLL